MPELRAAFHSPRVVRKAAVARVAVQLCQLEQVLIPGPASAGPEQLLLDESPDPRRRAVAEVFGSLGDRERPRRTQRTRQFAHLERRHVLARACVPSRQLAAPRRSCTTHLESCSKAAFVIRQPISTAAPNLIGYDNDCDIGAMTGL
jgi:hypothetical protein